MQAMDFYANNLYHIYNRGNNKQQIFFNDDNYLFFLNKIQKHLLPQCDLLAYCLMPNHFHLLVYTKTLEFPLQLNNAIAIILRSYSQAINKRFARVGSLFQQKTKAKLLNTVESVHYAFICFNYIHQNPIKARLIARLEDWEFSSFRDYLNLRNGTLVNKTLGRELLDLPKNEKDFLELSYKAINDDLINGIFD
jgi:putative transposase